MAFADKGTKYQGVNTCIEHLKELGITHVHLLPVEDYALWTRASPGSINITGVMTLRTSTALRGHIPPILMTLSAG